jgi:hypothetical protein
MSRWRKISMVLSGSMLLAACAANGISGKDAEVDGSTDPKQILQAMTQQLASAPGFSVTIRSDYDAVQTDGQSIAFSEKREVQLQRPDRLRIDTLRSDGAEGMLLFDGKTATAFKPQQNAYVQVAKTGTVDNTVVYLVKDLQMTLPLARLLLTTLPQEMDKLVTEASYVERDVLTDVPTDHIALRSKDVDVQLWITRSAERVPLRIVITYLHEAGQPQFRAELTDWDLTPDFGKDVFTWTPPAGTERIDVLTPNTQAQGVTP